VYETVEDERIRVEVKVSNNDKHFFASLLCDSGAQSELTLPARKIIQLGLTILKEGRVKSSTNQSKANLYFEPAVKVQIYFRRDNEVIEEKVALCTVSCLKDEYDAECAKKSIEPTTTEVEATTSDRLSIQSSAPVAEHIKVKLSPAQHRTSTDRDSRVVLGTIALRALSLNANFETNELEIREELIYDE